MRPNKEVDVNIIGFCCIELREFINNAIIKVPLQLIKNEPLSVNIFIRFPFNLRKQLLMDSSEKYFL